MATLITHAAGVRQRRLRHATLWGTAAGVEVLLEQTRWKLEEHKIATTKKAPLTRWTDPADHEYLQRIVEEQFFEDEEVI